MPRPAAVRVMARRLRRCSISSPISSGGRQVQSSRRSPADSGSRSFRSWKMRCRTRCSKRRAAGRSRGFRASQPRGCRPLPDGRRSMRFVDRRSTTARPRRRRRVERVRWRGRATRHAAAERMWLDEPFVLDDDVLGMLFACCTPSLGRETAIALTLTVVAGFTAHEAAQAFLVSEAAMAQRLVRAKRRLRESGAPVSIPTAAELSSRLPQVLDVVYLMFNEGYMASDGDALMREEMCGEAARLAVLLSEHVATAAPEADALAALLLFQLARLPARAATDGGPVLLEAQDRSSWDPALIAAGFHHLARGGARRGRVRAPPASGDRVAARHGRALRADGLAGDPEGVRRTSGDRTDRGRSSEPGGRRGASSGRGGGPRRVGRRRPRPGVARVSLVLRGARALSVGVRRCARRARRSGARCGAHAVVTQPSLAGGAARGPVRLPA